MGSVLLSLHPGFGVVGRVLLRSSGTFFVEATFCSVPPLDLTVNLTDLKLMRCWQALPQARLTEGPDLHSSLLAYVAQLLALPGVGDVSVCQTWTLHGNAKC